jgi:hypothetical protein
MPEMAAMVRQIKFIFSEIVAKQWLHLARTKIYTSG